MTEEPNENGSDPRLVEIGQRIRERRESLDYSQAYVGEQVGLTRTSITNIEQGRQNSTLLHFFGIAEALHMPAADLLPGGPPVVARLTGEEQDELEAMRRRIEAMLGRLSPSPAPGRTP